MRIDWIYPMRQAKKYRVYRRMLVNFVALVVTAVFLASVLLTVLYADNAFRESEKRTMDQLAQTDYSASVVYKQAEAVSYALNESPRIIRFFSLAREDKVAKYQAQLEMAKYKAMYSYVANISVVNARAGVETNCLNTIDDREFFRENASKGSVRVVDRTIYPYLGDNKATGVDVVSLIFPSTNGAGGVVIDLRAALFRGFLQARETNGGAVLLLTDKNGRVVLSTGEGAPPEDTPEGASVEYRRIGGWLYQVACADIEGFGWRIYRIEPVGSMLASYGALLRNTLFVSALAAAAGIALAVIVAQEAYHPIASLLEKTMRPKRADENAVDEYGALDEAFSAMRREGEETRKALREMCLAGLLASDMPAEDPMHALGLSEEGPYMTLAFADENADDADASARVFAIASVAKEVLRDVSPCEVARDGYCAVALLRAEGASVPERLPLALDEMRERLQAKYGVRLAVAQGDVVPSLKDVPASAEKARERLRYAYYYIEGETITADAVAALRENEALDAEALARLLSEAARDATEGKDNAEAALLQAASGMDPDENKRALARCARKALEKAGIAPEEYVSSIEASRHYAETGRVVAECVRALAASESGRAAQKNRQTAQKVREYIDTHYPDEGLSLQSVATEIGLSPGYVGRVFKAACAETFGDYLTRTRLAKARLLLLETDMNVSEITKRVGINNAAYFSTLFRKAYGTTPSALRESKKSA